MTTPRILNQNIRECLCASCQEWVPWPGHEYAEECVTWLAARGQTEKAAQIASQIGTFWTPRKEEL